MTVYVPAEHSSFHPTSFSSRQEVTAGVRQIMILLGVPIDNLSMEETLTRIEDFVRIGRTTGKTHQVATVNTDFLVRSLEDEKLRGLLQNIDMCTADGMPLVWGSQLLGVPLKERVAGSDMVPMLAARAARARMTMYFMGSAEGVPEIAKNILEKENPGLDIVGTSSPFWKPGEAFDPTILEEIKTLKPDILLVALGNPKQELWIEQYGKEVGVPVAIGIGASLDFIAGKTKRAPEWMQRSGLEWMSRLSQEPGRLWKRYTRDFVRFGPSILRQWWFMCGRTSEKRGYFGIDGRAIGDTMVLNLSGDLTYRRSEKLLRTGQQALIRRQHLTINLADVGNIDCSAVGALMELRKVTRSRGGKMRIVGLNNSMQQVFEMLNVSQFFGIDDASVVHGWQG